MSQIEVPPLLFTPLNSDACPSKILRVEDEALDLSNLEHGPRLCKQINEAYIKVGPYQPILSEYTASNSKKHPRYFQPSCFKQFFWLQYSPSKDAVFYLSCFLFNSNPSSRFRSIVFTHNGFSNWKKKVKDVLKSAPQNASYTSSTIQKEILSSTLLWMKRETIHVKDTISLTLKNEIFNVLLQHSFDIENIQGQGYDGESNMRGEFNGLQDLILNDSLVAAAREVVEVYQFFKDLSDIINIASASFKQHNELQKAQAVEITHLVSINELEIGTRMNQIGTLQHPGETRWSSHLNSGGDAHYGYNRFKSFKFIFILHMTNEVLVVIDNLCQDLQCWSQDILNAMSLVLTTKDLIQKLGDDGWNELLKNVISFCETWKLDFPDMNAQYIVSRSRSKKEGVTAVELLNLTTTLDSNEFFKLFDVDKIYIIVNKFYPKDFSQQEKKRLPYGLKHYELDACKHPDLRKISTLSELCRSLVESGKLVMYPLVDRLIHLLLTLLISTASLEHAFSAMKIVKTRLRSKMEDDFLSSLVVYIEKEIVEKFDVNEIIDDFSEVNDQKVQFK
ncbi:hypothetical protein ES332_A10G107300v1 [Gossypium tomentosum]|uniref:TTF-type domain-containing protein n=1 Tax=Gossypium tomentosum TaxID=34277 RepID=A0A5D2NNH7_GOSTO|nr:hypothetical protein ES332_A10G107300v1 [Gossypium tomentosum]